MRSKIIITRTVLLLAVLFVSVSAKAATNEVNSLVVQEKVFLKKQDKQIWRIGVRYDFHNYKKLNAYLTHAMFEKDNLDLMQATEEYINDGKRLSSSNKWNTSIYVTAEEFSYVPGRYVCVKYRLTNTANYDYVTYDIQHDKIVEVTDIFTKETIEELTNAHIRTDIVKSIRISNESIEIAFANANVSCKSASLSSNNTYNKLTDEALAFLGTSREIEENKYVEKKARELEIAEQRAKEKEIADKKAMALFKAAQEKGGIQAEIPRGQNNRIGTLSVSGNDEKGEVLKAKVVIASDPVKPIDEENKVFDVVEQMPEFPGGMGALMQYLSTNIKYPESAEEQGIQGRVICTFIVERDGSITDVRIAKSIDPSLDNEAIRVVSSMPKWNPGKQKGSSVRFIYTLPVTFRLQ